MAGPSIHLAQEPDFELGSLSVRPSASEVVGPEGPKRIEPRVMQVLVALSRRANQTVSRDELIERCWEGAAVTDDALTRCISQLRRIFTHTAAPATIETVSKIGYRLKFAPSTSPRRPRKAVAWATGAVAVAASAWLVWPVADREADPAERLSVPVTTLPGLEQWPDISPSGGQVVYSWRPEPAAASNLYVQSVGSEARRKLTDSDGEDYYPVWSPDGSHVVFARRSGGSCGIHRVAATGGAATLLTSCGGGDLTSMDWAPDGDALLYTTSAGAREGGRAYLFDLASGETSQLLGAGVEDVAFSPDGTELGYTLVEALGVEDLYVYSFASGRSERVTADHLKIHGFDWLPSGDGFVVSSNRGGEFALWLVPRQGSPEPLAGAVGGADEPKVSATGRIVYESWRVTANVWSLDPSGSREPEPLVASTRYDWDASRSPDGSRLVFLSDRSGASEVWLAASDGSGARRLTDFGGAYTHTPRFSPEGDRIAFATPANGNFDVYRIDADATAPIRVTTSQAEDFAPTWSPDGRALFFGSNRSGSWQIWRADLETGERLPITKTGGRAGQISPDGRYLYYVKAERAGLWRLELDSRHGAESLVVEDLDPVDWNNWQVLGDRLYYVSRQRPDAPELRRLDLATGATETVAELPDLLYKSGLFVAPDESEILVTRVATRESDILLAELSDSIP